MLNWYKTYDQETFMVDFKSVNYKKFNPYNTVHNTRENTDTPMLNLSNENATGTFQTIFEDSNAFSQMFYQFELLQREQIKIRPIQDPFAEVCMVYARRSCILITNELMQAHLIVSQNMDDK